MASQATPTSGSPTTTFTYLGLSNQLLSESKNGTLSKSYNYTPAGERLSQELRLG